MKVLELESFDRDALIAGLKTTRLAGFGGVRPYAHASIELAERFDPDDARPAQRYVLTPGVEAVLELREAVLAFAAIDIFALDGGLRVRTSEAPDELIPVLPPVLEESLERDGEMVLLINDGIHRMWAARSLGMPINAVVVRGVPPEYPYYAYALPDGWAGVTPMDALPDVFQKKEYRDPAGYQQLFREFNEPFPGVQKVRKQSNPDHLQP